MKTKELAEKLYQGIDEPPAPDSKEELIFGEIDRILEENMDYSTRDKLISLILDYTIEGTKKFYMWGFCTGIEIAKAINETNDALPQSFKISDCFLHE